MFSTCAQASAAFVASNAFCLRSSAFFAINTVAACLSASLSVLSSLSLSLSLESLDSVELPLLLLESELAFTGAFFATGFAGVDLGVGAACFLGAEASSLDESLDESLDDDELDEDLDFLVTGFEAATAPLLAEAATLPAATLILGLDSFSLTLDESDSLEEDELELELAALPFFAGVADLAPLAGVAFFPAEAELGTATAFGLEALELAADIAAFLKGAFAGTELSLSLSLDDDELDDDNFLFFD
jgi:hypothetical protein